VHPVKKNLDSELSSSNYADMLAFVALFEEKFIPAFKHLCWLDEENTYTVIRRAYGNYCRFPLSIFKIKSMASYAENSLLSNYKLSHVTYDAIKQQILLEAKECLNALSNKLGENTFLFENKPSQLDAYLFGYLTVLSNAPFASSSLKTHLIGSSNLCSLVRRVQKDYFSNDYASSNSSSGSRKSLDSQQHQQKPSWFKSFFFGKSSSSPSSSSSKSASTNEQHNEIKRQIFAVSVALTVMALYAFWTGMVKIDVIKNGDLAEIRN